MASTKILLTQPVEGLGAEADVVTVKAGYARNFLIPSGKAWEVTPATLKRLDLLRTRRAEREANELNEANDLARRINKLNSVIVVETGETGKAFGAVTANDIALKLKGDLGGKEIDRHRIVLESPIKGTGEFEIPVKLHPEVTAKLNLTVKPSREPASEDAAAPEAAAEHHAERRSGWRTRPRKIAPKD
jgi:large subunit ribosomal protein L9